MNPIVSIIVPVYNVEDYLKICLDSIINQTYKNLEIILVNDGSTDRSGKICDEYSKVENRIFVKHNENHGVSYSRNYGINLAKGKYLMFIDSDDSIKPTYVEKMVSAIEEQENIDLVICRYENIYYNYKNEIVVNNKELTGNYAKDLIKLYFSSCGPYVKLFKTEIITKWNIHFPEDISFSEDRIFNYEYVKHIRRYSFIDEVLYSYSHKNENSLSKSRSYKSYNDAIKVLKAEKIFLNEIRAENKDIILTNSAISYLSMFSKLAENKYNSYSLFLIRVKEIKKILDGVYSHYNFKRKIIAVCLKYNVILPIYFYYVYLKNFYRKVFFNE